MLSVISQLSTLPFRRSLPVGRCTFRKYLHIMKLSDDQMQSVLTPGVKQLAELFSKHGYELRVAGGAVRDLLMDKIPHDLDFATTATPEEMKKMFEEESVRLLNMGGEKHGTVTARLEEENFECTTLRIDVVTDGRHAEVEFTKDWELDAGRRDLTINAMFLGLDGTVYDYFDGNKHLKARYVAFVGDPDLRIQEDYLRILRYFRFYGRIADGPDKHNELVIESIKRNVAGLGKIAGERIWVEVQKIISGKYGVHLFVKMIKCGVGPYIGFPEEFDCDNLMLVYKRCEEAGFPLSDVHHMTLFAAGLTNEDEFINLIARIKCSNREREIMWFVMKNRDRAMQMESLKEVQDLVVDLVVGEQRNKNLSLIFVSEVLKYACKIDFLNQIKDWEIPRFPVNGNMILEKGVPKKQVKHAKRDLVDEWKSSNFALTDKELLSHLDMVKYTS